MLKKYLLLLILVFTIDPFSYVENIEGRSSLQRIKTTERYKPLKIIAKRVCDQKIKAKEIKNYKVAIFEDKGVLSSQIRAFTGCIDMWEHISYSLINTEQIVKSEIYEYDMLILPGGYATIESNTLGKEGRDRIYKYVRNGGGLLGVCAGSYLTFVSISWAIPLVDAVTVSPNWYRGPSNIPVELTDLGIHLFGDIPDLKLGYNNGAVFKKYGHSSTSDFQVLAYLRSGIGRNEYERELMKDTPAIIYSISGSGKVIIMNVHPEKVDKYKFMVKKIIYWLCEKEQYHIDLWNTNYKRN